MGIFIYYKLVPFFGIFFSLFGIAFFIQTLRMEYNKNKYKQVNLKLYEPSTILGSTLRGYVVINIPIENAKFLVTLENIHFYQTHESDGEGGLRLKIRSH